MSSKPRPKLFKLLARKDFSSGETVKLESLSSKVDVVEGDVKKVVETLKNAEKLYESLREENEKNRSLIYLGFIVIIITMLGVAIGFLEISMSYFNDKEESEYLNHRFISI